jgi:hypothetical protein
MCRSAISHAQRRLVLQPRRGLEQQRHFLYAENHRQLAWLVDDMGVLDDLVSLQRDLKKKSKRRYRLMVGTPTPLAARCS